MRTGGEACEQTEQRSYDSDSGLSDDNDGQTPAACKSEKDGDPASDVPDESLQEETDHESGAADNVKSDSDPNNGTGEYRHKPLAQRKRVDLELELIFFYSTRTALALSS